MLGIKSRYAYYPTKLSMKTNNKIKPKETIYITTFILGFLGYWILIGGLAFLLL